MKRRDFLKTSIPLTAIPVGLKGLPLSVFNYSNLIDCSQIQERILVVIQLFGANDGINTTIPLNQYTEYANLRPTIRIPETGAHKYIELDNSLGATQSLGLHPKLQAFKDLYDNGKFGIVQGVTYNNPNRSHFKSEDIWLSGGDGTTGNTIDDGWMGRFLSFSYPGVAGNPTSEYPDPLGIQLGQSRPSLGFHSPEEHDVAINLSNQNPAGYYELVSEVGGLPLPNVPANSYGTMLQHIMNVESSVQVYAQRITDVFNNGMNSVTVTYPNTSLGRQLRTVARLIAGGSTTKMYLAYKGGFDNHVDQVEDPGNPSEGKHADLLNDVAMSMAAFQQDLENMSLDQKVMTVTWSEFGRTADENANKGTDHGTLNPMFVMGTTVNAGVFGNNIDLQNIDRRAPTGQQFDYRQVFASILQDWLGASTDAVGAAYFDSYLANKINLVGNGLVADPSCYFPPPGPTPIRLQSEQDQASISLQAQLPFALSAHQLLIQRSKDGRKFKTIKTIEPAEDIQGNYLEYTDDDPKEGISYYRIVQKNFWGKEKGATIQKVYVRPAFLINAQLVPIAATQNGFDLHIRSSKAFDAQIEIFASTTSRLKRQEVSVKEGYNRLSVDTNFLPKGTHQLLFSTSKHDVHEEMKIDIQ